ncbi:hypothetical protein [Georgenia sp. AZ-5]|uniref:hypothetical protein n=1 Tax=Georgenia sp. AZ-5 TaxID=3367526 RepID=UPI003754E6DC
MTTRTWADLTAGQRAGLMATAAVQPALTATAWADLARRPAREVDGSEARWATLIAVNFIGLVLYLTRGRRPASRRA